VNLKASCRNGLDFMNEEFVVVWNDV